MGIVVVREVAGVALGYRRDYLAELRVVLAEYVIGELPYRIVSGKLIVRGVAFIDYIVVAPVLAGRGVDFVRIEAGILSELSTVSSPGRSSPLSLLVGTRTLTSFPSGS